MYHKLLSYSSVDGHSLFSCFFPLNDAAVNLLGHISSKLLLLFLGATFAGARLLGQGVHVLLILIDAVKFLSQKISARHISSAKYQSTSSSSPPGIWYYGSFCQFKHKIVLLLTLLCLSLTTSEFEQLLLRLLACWPFEFIQ